MNRSTDYLAFISYRHADNKLSGRQWATWLHQALETYQIPADLVGQTNDRGETIPSQIFPVFRDEDELPADADLANSITKALDNTGTLIVLCSPNAVASTYVADEIDYFKSLGRSDRIIAALIDGEPNCSWDSSKAELGFATSDECFPLPLQFAYDDQGQRTEQRAEPIAADFRLNLNGKAQQGWTSTEALKQHLRESESFTKEQLEEVAKKYDEQQHLMLLKIVAGILGVPLGALTQRDKEYQLALARQKAKRLRQWLSAVAMLAVVAVAAGIFAYFKQQEAIKNEHRAQQQTVIAQENERLAKEQRDQSLIGQSRFLLDQAKQANESQRYNHALLLGLNALPGDYGGERPLVDDLSAMREAYFWHRKKAQFNYSENIVEQYFLSDTNLLVVTERQVFIENFKTAAESKLLKVSLTGAEKILAASLSSDKEWLAVATSYGGMQLLNLSGKDSIVVPAKVGFKHVIVSEDVSSIFAFGADNQLYRWSFENRSFDYQVAIDELSFSAMPVLSKDSKYIYYETVTSDNNQYQANVVVYESNTGRQIFKHPSMNNGSIMGFHSRVLPNDTIMVYQPTGFSVFNLKDGALVNKNEQQFVSLSPNLEYFLFFAIEPSQRTELGLFHQPSQNMVMLKALGEMSRFQFSNDGSKLITVHFGTLFVWNTQTGLLENKLKVISDTNFLLSDDGNFVSSYSRYGEKLGVWSTKASHNILPLDKDYENYGSQLSENGQYAIVGLLGDRSRYDLVNASTGESLFEFTLKCRRDGEFVWSSAFNRISYRCWEGDGYVIDIPTQQHLALVSEEDSMRIKSKFSQKQFLYLTSKWQELDKLKIVTVKQSDEPSSPVLEVKSDTVWENTLELDVDDYELSPDHTQLLIQSDQLPLKLVNLSSNKVLDYPKDTQGCEILKENDRDYVWLACRSNQLLKLSWSKPGELQILDLDSQVRKVVTHSLSKVAFAVSENKRLYSLNVETMEKLGTPTTYESSPDVYFSNDGAFYFIEQLGTTIYKTHERQPFFRIPSDVGNGIVYSRELNNFFMMKSQALHRFVDGKVFSRPAIVSLTIKDDDLIEKTKAILTLNERCLSDEQRANYYLFPLDEEARIRRQCANR